MTGASLYIPGNSWLHRLHPAVKVAGAAVLFIVFLAFNDPAYLIWPAVGAVALLVSGSGVRPMYRMGFFLTILFVASAALWAIFLDDPAALEMLPKWQIGPVQVTRGTLLYGLAMALRIVGMVIVGLAIITTTRPEEFSYGLRALGLPPIFATAIALSFYLLPMFISTALIVRQAQQARGLELLRLPVWKRFLRSVAVVVPVMGYALRRADDLTRALELWGVGGRKPTYMYQRPVAFGEVLLFLAAICLAAISIYERVSGHGAILPRL